MDFYHESHKRAAGCCRPTDFARDVLNLSNPLLLPDVFTMHSLVYVQKENCSVIEAALNGFCSIRFEALPLDVSLFSISDLLRSFNFQWSETLPRKQEPPVLNLKCQDHVNMSVLAIHRLLTQIGSKRLGSKQFFFNLQKCQQINL